MNRSRVATVALCAITLFAGASCTHADAETEPPAPEGNALAPVPFDPTVLAGREWRLVALPGPDEVAVPPGTHAMLRFEPQPDGSWQASGYGPCNQIATPVAFTGDTIEFQRIGMSKRACAELALESRWIERMRAGKATVVVREDGRLELDRDGVAVMVFEAGPVE